MEEIIKGPVGREAPAAARAEASVQPWPKPPPGKVALSVDGSYLHTDGSAAAGMVLRNHDGSVIFSAYRYIFNCNDALEAELHALMQGMALAIQHCELPAIVQSDSSVALSALSGDSLSRSAYGHLVTEIRHLMVDRVFIPMKISCVQNRGADRLALYSRTERATVVWLGRGPPCIEDLLPRDCNPIPLE